MRTLGLALAGLVLGGCFIDELPAYDDNGSGMTGTAPELRSLTVGPNGTTCAVLKAGTVRCWGTRFPGLFPQAVGVLQRPVAVDNVTGVEVLGLGGYHGCLLAAGQVSCFGDNPNGQVGNGQVGGMGLAPAPVVGLTSVTQLSVGYHTNGAVISDGSARIWGAQRISGAIPSPMPVAGLTGVTAIVRGDDHDCAIHGGGTVSCWGYNSMGQLGRGTIATGNMTVDETPAPVIGVTDATQVTLGADSCALHTDGTVSCWGYQTYSPAQPTPTPVAGLTGVTKLVAGGNHTCALKADGTLWCWGANNQGALGIGADPVGSTMPIQVPGLTNLVDAAAGGSSTCAVRADHAVFCWGGGLPGNGASMSSPVPVQVTW